MEKKTILYLILAVALLALIMGAATMYAVATREPFPPGNAPAWLPAPVGPTNPNAEGSLPAEPGD